MAVITPITIEHIHLENAISFNKKGHFYLIFWWYSIPLGHLFIELDRIGFNDRLIREKIFDSIAPTISSYTANNKSINTYQQVFVERDNLTFKSMMNELFSPFLHEVFPVIADISVIICTRNRSEDLRICLQSLFDQLCKPKEIIVIDNAPTDNLTKTIVSQFKNVIYNVEEEPGLSKARNKGISIAKCPVIAWIDDDVTIHPLWIARIHETFKDPKVQACTGLVIASQLETESQQIFERYWSFNRGFQDKIYDTVYFNSKLSVGPPVWEIGAGANMAFTKKIFNEVGYFDERLGAGASGCSEDSEMWYRILNKGYNINYNPRIVVYHTHRKDLKSLHKQLFNYMRGFAVAALIQQEQNANAGYQVHLSKVLPRYYFQLLKHGFPFYLSRYRTVFSEIKGFLSGKKLYYKSKKENSVKFYKSG
jgi:glycosyltransferase involved in cell wall biosynthesis